ncbi:PREDICTED: eukaryotic initiation factor 4A-I isoform X1 [Nelumbo nucifera]|uniref:Eukaryotic initiation factor 4A-I isoform X1 n=1 Tax=Nelumbo nucifera TaxID=4432 RepID=A0A1U8ALJ7_NELNU|nr:PREDICTED: eukaryotic initiation factor 4A-I isoform X1 [Nelumbo nucifera]
MAIDAVESPSSSSSPSALHFRFCDSQPRHYYVAVDRIQFKMETLVDLLGVAGRRSSLPMVLCCSSRDELDAVCSAVSNLPYISLTSLYSDLAEAERISVFDKFCEAVMEWNQNIANPEEDIETGNQENKSHVVVVTDACLPLLASGESPISARVLINYELPTKKETYLRRMTTCLAADGIVINMVVGGEVVTLKSIEESSGIVIAEMPIHISEIL